MTSSQLVIAPVVRLHFRVPARVYPSLEDIYLSIAQGSAPGGMLRTGEVIWDGSKVLGQWIASGRDFAGGAEGGTGAATNPECSTLCEHPFHDKAVLELGAGVTGIPGLVALACGAARVVFTDLADQCPTLTRNIRDNTCKRRERDGVEAMVCGRKDGLPCASECDCPLSTRRAVVAPFDWTEPLSVLCDRLAGLPSRHFDYVLAADVVYEGTWELLAALITSLLLGGDAPGGVTADAVVMVNAQRRATHRLRRWLASDSRATMLRVDVIDFTVGPGGEGGVSGGEGMLAWVITRRKS